MPTARPTWSGSRPLPSASSWVKMEVAWSRPAHSSSKPPSRSWPASSITRQETASRRGQAKSAVYTRLAVRSPVEMASRPPSYRKSWLLRHPGAPECVAGCASPTRCKRFGGFADPPRRATHAHERPAGGTRDRPLEGAEVRRSLSVETARDITDVPSSTPIMSAAPPAPSHARAAKWALSASTNV